MKNRMGIIDQGFVPAELTVSYVAICAGDVDTDLLRRAFELTCRRYPMLGGNVEFADGRYHLRVPEPGAGNATARIDQGSISHWLRQDAPLDPTLSLAKLEIVRDDATTAVALRVSHAINDAHLGFVLLADFWRTAAALAAPAPGHEPAPIFPRSLEELLYERAIAVPEVPLPDPSGLYSLAPTETLDGSGLRLAPEERILLSPGETSELLQRARAQGTTLHALLSAAIIRAERVMVAETSGPAAGIELPMIIGHAVDLRPHLQPPARPIDATNGLGYAATVTACAPESDLPTLAKEAKEQIVNSIDSGAALAAMFAVARIAAGETREAAVNVITNWGVIPALECPKGLRIVDFRGFVTGHAIPEISYFVYTFEGRLNIEFAFSDTYHRPARIAELRRGVAANLMRLLHDFTDSRM